MPKKTRNQKRDAKKLIDALPVVVTQAKLKKRSTLGDLLARCDPQSPGPVLSGWDGLDSPLVGEELI
ncbi:hypothetical protein [Methylovorus mays]|uniref:hypothetical protein n=1 Tax=Methylovorus mays TaxID=184077 RepID=UPI001E44AD5F|nr:hypothetical protein [Methylovorus mays]MCB5206712.1 hypothetical protein [Methylovorus mays]